MLFTLNSIVIEFIMNNFSNKPDYALLFGKTDYVRERLVNCRSIGDTCIPYTVDKLILS